MSDFDREASILSFISFDAPLAVESLATNGLHLDRYAAEFFLRAYPAMQYEKLYELMRKAEDGTPLPGDGPEIWFDVCDDEEKSASLKRVAGTKHYLQRIVIRYYWDNVCPERRRIKESNLKEGLVRFMQREPDNRFAVWVLSQIDPSYWGKRKNCAEMFPPDWQLVNYYANKAVRDGDFSAYSILSKAKIEGDSILPMLAEGSYSSEYDQDWVLTWIQENASEYFWEIADFCDAEVRDAEITELLGCYRESHENDIKCLSYTDYFVAGVRKITMSVSYKHVRVYLMNHGDMEHA